AQVAQARHHPKSTSTFRLLRWHRQAIDSAATRHTMCCLVHLRAFLKVHGTGVRALKEDRDALVSWIVLCVSVPLLSCGGGGPGAGMPLQPGVIVRVSLSTDTLTVSHTLQFTATVNGTSDTASTWNVNGILGGNGTTGTISSTGLYAAPVV